MINLIRYGKEEVYKNPKNDQIIRCEKYLPWRFQLPLIKLKKKLLDKNGKEINPFHYEQFEQYLVFKYIKPDDVVLELGARYGIVSNTINLLLNNKTNHVVVEPDKTIIPSLKLNKKIFNSKFKICDKAISNTKNLYYINQGIGSYTTNKIPNDKSINYKKIKTISSHDFFKKYPLKFNVLIVDCEGCLLEFLNENLFLLDQIELIIFEKDWDTRINYSKVYKILTKNNFIKEFQIFKTGFQQVWIKKIKNKK